MEAFENNDTSNRAHHMCRTHQAVLAFLFLLSAVIPVFGQSSKIPVELLTVQGVKQYAEAKNIDTVEQLMDHLPDVLLNNYVLMEDSRSRQKPSTVRKPRIILFLPDGSFFLGIATNKDSVGYDDAEMIVRRSDQTWRLGALRLESKADKHRVLHSAGKTVGERKSCRDCHGGNSRPIWGRYPTWPGAFANGAGHDLTATQAQALNDGLESGNAHENPRLKRLNWVKRKGWMENDDFDLPDRHRGLNNEAMNDAVGASHFETLWKRIERAKHSELLMLAVTFERGGFGEGISGVPGIKAKLKAIVEKEWKSSGLKFPNATTTDKALLLLGLDAYDDLFISKGLHELTKPENEQSQFRSSWNYIAIYTGDYFIIRFMDYLLREHPELTLGKAMVESKFEYSRAYPSIFAYHRDNVRYMRELSLTEQIAVTRSKTAPTVGLRYEHMFTKTLQGKIVPSLIGYAKKKIAEYESSN